MPDIVLPVARGENHGLYIELKIIGNRPSKEQKEWLKLLKEQGYRAVVCYGSEEAIKEIETYLGGGKWEKHQ